MTPYHSDAWLTVYAGDCRDVLRELPSESVNCIVTSPPYWGLRDYGVDGQLGLEATPELYVEHMVEVFRELRRVLRPDGTAWLNLGDSYATGGGSVGRAPGGGEQGERLMVGTQPNRMPIPGLKPKDLAGIPWRVAFALQADGWWLRSDIVWSKPNPMPESVMDRPTKSHEYVFLLTKSERYHFDADAVKEQSVTTRPELLEFGDRPNVGYPGHSNDRRRDKQAATGAQRVKGGDRWSGFNDRWDASDGSHPAGRNIRSVWNVATRPYPGAHFAVFPPEIPERCIKAGCPGGGTVLDPFAGSGTVGLVANRLSRRAVLIDLNPAYIEQQMRRNAQTPLGIGA